MNRTDATFSRKQLGALTLLEDSTLNYWSREEVLRPLSGGGGKGQHKRFAASEVMLAAILGEIRHYGVSIGPLRSLANRFHTALDWMSSAGISRKNREIISTLLSYRRTMDKEGGLYSLNVTANSEIFPQKMRYGEYSHLRYIDLNWEEIILHLRNSWYKDQLTDSNIAIALSVDDESYLENSSFHSLLTITEDRVPGEDFSSSPTFFVRSLTDEWTIKADGTDAAAISISFIGVDVERLTYDVWARA